MVKFLNLFEQSAAEAATARAPLAGRI
jgi:hypothetical protein